MGAFDKTLNEFNEYGIPKSTFNKCNHCFLLFKELFKKLQMIWK